jgi:hypothetical protein
VTPETGTAGIRAHDDRPAPFSRCRAGQLWVAGIPAGFRLRPVVLMPAHVVRTNSGLPRSAV